MCGSGNLYYSKCNHQEYRNSVKRAGQRGQPLQPGRSGGVGAGAAGTAAPTLPLQLGPSPAGPSCPRTCPCGNTGPAESPRGALSCPHSLPAALAAFSRSVPLPFPWLPAPIPVPGGSPFPWFTAPIPVPGGSRSRGLPPPSPFLAVPVPAVPLPSPFLAVPRSRPRSRQFPWLPAPIPVSGGSIPVPVGSRSHPRSRWLPFPIVPVPVPAGSPALPEARPEARGARRSGPAAGGAGPWGGTAMALAMPLLEPPWPPGLAPLKAVDDLLRCGICFDYFSIAVIIPQCSHSYCSLCIRKSLSYKTQCPTCCVAVSESDLKNNRILDDLVKSFNSARQQLLQLVLEAPPVPSPPAHSQCPAQSHWSPGSQPESEEVPGTDSSLSKDKVCTSTKAGGLAWTGQKRFKTEEHHDLHSPSAEAGGKDSKAISQEIPGCTQSHEKPSTSVLKGDRKVECPVCEVAILEQYINKHLDSCLTRGEKKDSLRSSDHKRKLMSKVVYNLLSDRDLRKKLKEHGLSTSGTRQQLIKRHQEFVHMYNAQCDSLHPKSVAEVVKELEKNEKVRVQLECNKPGENSLTFTKDQTEEEIDEIHTEYRNKHRSEFKFLVDQVNKRWKKTAEGKAESAQNKEEIAVKELPAASEPGEEDPTAGKAQALQPEIPDGPRSESHGLKEWQRSASPEFSLSSGSTCSTNSDILADVEGSETCSASSDSSSSVALTRNKRRLRRPRVPEDSGAVPQGKRKRS